MKTRKKTKNEFVEMVAHELRAPLGAIRAASSMLGAGDYGKLPTKAQEAVHMIEDAATRLLLFADTFLDESRVSVDSYESTPVRVNVTEEVQRIVRELMPSAKAKKIALDLRVEVRVPEVVRLDKDILHIAVFNLLDNAIKYTDRGQIVVSVSSERSHLLIEVADTGRGLNAEEARNVFKKFYRVKNVGRGSGLGLAIVKRMVEAIGGSVSVASAGKSKGSRFTLRLPVKRA